MTNWPIVESLNAAWSLKIVRACVSGAHANVSQARDDGLAAFDCTFTCTYQGVWPPAADNMVVCHTRRRRHASVAANRVRPDMDSSREFDNNNDLLLLLPPF